jgi:hypothetical protein
MDNHYGKGVNGFRHPHHRNAFGYRLILEKLKMPQCRKCGSYAINEHSHGREKGKDSDLCDVCYWRKRANGFTKYHARQIIDVFDIENALEEIGDDEDLSPAYKAIIAYAEL